MSRRPEWHPAPRLDVTAAERRARLAASQDPPPSLVWALVMAITAGTFLGLIRLSVAALADKPAVVACETDAECETLNPGLGYPGDGLPQ